MGTTGDIPQIIDDLYAGTLDNDAWGRGIIGLADLVSGSGALLLNFNPITGEVRRDETHHIDPAVVAEYRNHWAQRDVRLAPGNLRLVGEPQFEAKLLAKKTWNRSEIYNDFLLRVDAPSILAFWLHKAPNKVVALTIQGTKRRGQFDERDGERVQPLIPHLRRALEIRDRLEAAQLRADSLANSLQNVNFGVLLLDARGLILESNSVAEHMMRTEPGIRRTAERTVSLSDPAGTQLARWIIGGKPSGDSCDGLLHVQRPNACAISILVTPLPATMTSWTGCEPRWVLLLFDPDRRIHASKELIVRDLGISEREAEVAALLVAGYDICSIAQRLKISTHTARTHLKTIFSKTGTHSKSELILRVANGPASIVQERAPTIM